eukprot:TRINITY_DN64730_c0_g1_i1.p1 TRINITY_DN64730_c0_g1~~TRINITY_DN64730_c0_g1_i1.p1  ORF type:complete len:440 (+),score=54.45 TRINITY_DN64730_c0_g1_i1:59-1321(+)
MAGCFSCFGGLGGPKRIGDSSSLFANVPLAPADPILSLATRFKADPNPKKVNLGIGAYRTAQGKPWILGSVAEAEKLVINDPNGDKEYQPIDGKPEYKKAVQQLIFADAVIASGCVATCQALSGTGSLQIVGQFMKFIGCRKVHGPSPTWGNHPKIFIRAGLEYATYPYWHQEKRGLDFDGMMAAINRMKCGEAILLHAVAHNPTGVDPTPEQWAKIVDAVQAKKLIPLLDNAYQGYASGNLENDGLAQNLFTASGMEFFVCQSFAKNFGLYGERIGYIHVKCNSAQRADAVLSQLKICVRQAYSSPPKHGAAIVNKILTTPALKTKWLHELEFMATRIVQMRQALRTAIEEKKTPGSWKHVTDQIGMFTFTGLSKAQVECMVNNFSIYMTADGRISMAGLNPGNVQYVADCIDSVVRTK